MCLCLCMCVCVCVCVCVRVRVCVCSCSFEPNLGLVVPNFGFKGVGECPIIGPNRPEVDNCDFMFGNKAKSWFPYSRFPDVLDVPTGNES
jgi:hypothetical protein